MIKKSIGPPSKLTFKETPCNIAIKLPQKAPNVYQSALLRKLLYSGNTGLICKMRETRLAAPVIMVNQVRNILHTPYQCPNER